MRTLYYSCPAGICGDMNLGAMVDLGVDPHSLTTELEKLGLPDWRISFARDARKGISGTRCDVQHAEEHAHRTLADIRSIIAGSGLDAQVKADALAVFEALAQAEGAVHGKPAEEIHFHEVGAVDSILDITGAAVCWKLLGVDRIASGPVELGSGTVKCAHGRMPVPAPATARLVKDFPVTAGVATGEATTPTGAALLAGKRCVFGRPLAGRVAATGVGVGHRDDPRIANVLYATLLDDAAEQAAAAPAGEVLELATNLDDMSPERIAHLAALLMEAGALDVWQTPATFKKGRLGCVLSILIQPELREKVSDIVFRHSTTLGIRWRAWNRTILHRTVTERDTPLGPVRFKEATWQGDLIRCKPEYDDLSRIARAHDLPLDETERRINH